MRENTTHLAVEILEARNQDDRCRQPVGDLDQIARGFLKAFLGIFEEAQVFHLVDAEDERGTIHGPHQLAEAFDDFESATITRVRVQCRNCRQAEFIQRAAVQILPHPLINPRIVSLQVQQRTNDVDVEFLALKARTCDDIVGERMDQPRKLFLVERCLAQLFQFACGHHFRIFNEAAGKPGKRSFTGFIRVVGFLEGGDQAAQVIVSIARHVRRHLGVTEVSAAPAVRAGA